MNLPKSLVYARKRRFAALLTVSLLALFAWSFYAHGQNKSDFPDGYDAVQAAPNSHKVIFENAFVRVLQVTIPPAGTTEPMHHHRWPSFFLSWDTGVKRRMFVIIVRMAAFGTSRAEKSQFTPADGV